MEDGGHEWVDVLFRDLLNLYVEWQYKNEWVCSDGGIILTGERKPSQCHSVHHKSHTVINMMVLEEIHCENGKWMELAQDRVQWWALVLAVLNRCVLLSDLVN